MNIRNLVIDVEKTEMMRISNLITPTDDISFNLSPQAKITSAKDQCVSNSTQSNYEGLSQLEIKRLKKKDMNLRYKEKLQRHLDMLSPEDQTKLIQERKEKKRICNSNYFNRLKGDPERLRIFQKRLEERKIKLQNDPQEKELEKQRQKLLTKRFYDKKRLDGTLEEYKYKAKQKLIAKKEKEAAKILVSKISDKSSEQQIEN